MTSVSAPFRGLQTLPGAAYGPYLYFRSPPKSVQGPDFYKQVSAFSEKATLSFLLVFVEI